MPEIAPLGRDASGEHGGQRRLVDLQAQLEGRQAAPQVGEQVGDPGGERLGHVAAGRTVAEDASPERPQEGGRERPGAAH